MHRLSAGAAAGLTDMTVLEYLKFVAGIKENSKGSEKETDS